MIEATPLFFSAPWVDAGHWTVSPLPRVHAAPPAAFRNFVKLLVVPEASERCTTTIAVEGSVAPALSAAIFGSFHVVIAPLKMPPSVSPDSCSFVTPDRLYDTVMGAATVGK